ncbi:2,3,4,5-tetrahydropyridine-2,6-dicarboxylate N-acetyltransferase [Methylibium sp. T29]|nr:2,3,4,5-tetrahydropyridine-2,6-dicarboxylate N-acetyltransferase [Methylibium sp. T29]
MPCYAIDGVLPVVDPSAYVHPTAVLIGDVIVGAHCYVGPCACLRGDFGRIVIGPGANVQDNCVLHGFPDQATVVEENGHIGHGAVLHGCVVRRDALVGMNAVVMDEAEVGAQAIVAACAFVPAGMQVPPRTLVAGTPARPKRLLSDARSPGNSKAPRPTRTSRGAAATRCARCSRSPRLTPTGRACRDRRCGR